MLQKMRAGAQTFGAKVLAGIICFVLVVFGFGAFNLFAVSEPAVVKVNGDPVTENELQRSVEVQRQNFRRTYGSDLDPAYVERVINNQTVLRQLINNRLVKQKAEQIGFESSKKEFVDRLQSNPAFQLDGEFDSDQFIRVISRAGYSPQSYEASAREDYVISRLARIQENTSFVTEREVRDASAIAGQTRDIAFIVFESNSFLGDYEPTDEEVFEYYEENSEDFMTREEYEIAYVVLDRKMFEADLLVDDSEVVEAYEAEKKVAESNAERKASHILLHVDGSRTSEDATRQLIEVRKRVLEGESFADIAGDISDDVSTAINGGDLGFAGRGLYVPEFEQVLFGMEIDEISAPFETEFGVHIIQLHEIQEVEHPSFEEREAELRESILADLATPAFEEAIAELEQITYEKSLSLEPAATALGLEIQTQAGISRSNGDPPFDAYRVRSELLDGDVLTIDANSRPIEVSDSQTLVGRIVSRTEPKLRPVDEVRPQIEGGLKSLRSRKLAEEARDEALSSLEVSKDYSAVADQFEFEWNTFDATQRNNSDVDREIIEAAFNERLSTEGERKILSVDINPIEFAIVVVSRMAPGDYNELPQATQTQIRDELQDGLKTNGLISFIDSLRSEASLKYQIPELAETP
ncbi:MAG: SurA N-terminal domain-containing protein [Gammaproteobacteria bacterium]|nr:SurA N-terminal domain-containing protein [Gammaproteobacteria bacterium]